MEADFEVLATSVQGYFILVELDLWEIFRPQKPMTP